MYELGLFYFQITSNGQCTCESEPFNSKKRPGQNVSLQDCIWKWIISYNLHKIVYVINKQTCDANKEKYHKGIIN